MFPRKDKRLTEKTGSPRLKAPGNGVLHQGELHNLSTTPSGLPTPYRTYNYPDLGFFRINFQIVLEPLKSNRGT